MNIEPKVLIPNKEWILKKDNRKIGSIYKNKKGYYLIKNGTMVNLTDPSEFGIKLPEKTINSKIEINKDTHFIYEYPCSSKPYSPVYNILKKLPIFTKSNKSKSHFCAGYYIIKFRKGWVKSFCPKLITLERYGYKGPFKTEQEMKQELNSLKL